MSKSKRVIKEESIVSKAVRATKRSVLLSHLYKKEQRETKVQLRGGYIGDVA